MTVKIGFYICHCGINIAHKVDVKEVAAFVRQMENVAVARDYKFMCSDPGQEMIENDILNMGLNRVVVASCSPRLHEKTFRGVCQRSGLNPYYFQMASVREQVSWVTKDAGQATQKAKTLAAAAVTRVNFHESLQTRKVDVHPDVLIVGGGIAGMQAALDIGNSGHKVYLVEKDTTIGGHMLQFDKTFPTLDCAACIGTPKMVDVAQHPQIDLMTYSEVAEVSGYIGNYTVKIHKKARYVKQGVCTGCGECAKACPVAVPSQWDVGLGSHRAVYRAFPQAVPITFCIDKKDRAPCQTGCPAGVNVQGYVQLIKSGKYKQALALIMEKIPLPGVLGRVCPHPCESKCRRSLVDEPIAIRDLKRFASDAIAPDSRVVPLIDEKDQKIAIIGSGPAGLSLAYFLRLNGYQVTLFEAHEKLGGMLRYGIPEYRLPKSILDAEINYILNLGVKVQTQTMFGKDFHINDLKDQGYDAIFLGTGAQRSLNLGIAGETTSPDVIDALTFLHNTRPDDTKYQGKHILAIGGGNVAIDAVRVAKRMKAEKVTLVYRRTATELPAYPEEVAAAREEGIEFLFLSSPIEVLTQNQHVTGLRCIRNELGKADHSSRRRPIPVEGSEFDINCDYILSAIGQQADTSWHSTCPELEWSSRHLLKVNPDSMQTSAPFIFAAGDAVTGPATVVNAVADAYKAAKGIDAFLQGVSTQPIATETKLTSFDSTQPDWADIPEGIAKQERAQITQLDHTYRVTCFDEESIGFDEQKAQAEAQRCLNCGICCECMQCVSVCEAKAIDHAMTPEDIEIKVGSIIIATGFDLLDPSGMKPFGYDKYPNVITSLEFERLSNATGPTGGKILMRDQNGVFSKPPESVALVHCVGSRDVNYHEYCSRVCCMYALKYSHLIKEKVGHHTPVYDFYIDMRCFGKGYEEFYRRCQEEGTVFIRGKVASVTDQAENATEKGKLVAIAEDTLLGKTIRIPVDMVVLCMAMQARSDAPIVGRTFGVNVGLDGFFLEEHPKLGPLETATTGVFLAGTCQSPKDIPDTVAQASGAAAKALALAVKGQVEVPSAISHIDPDICAGCQICIDLCAYGAIYFDQRRGISVINEAICKGCGSCSGFCPSGAAQIRHFKKKQIFAELNGIMDSLHSISSA